MEISAHLLPEPGQIPPGLVTDADVDRYKLAFAITRNFLGRDDPMMTSYLFNSELPTGNLSELPDPSSSEGGTA